MCLVHKLTNEHKFKLKFLFFLFFIPQKLNITILYFSKLQNLAKTFGNSHLIASTSTLFLTFLGRGQLTTRNLKLFLSEVCLMYAWSMYMRLVAAAWNASAL